MDPRLTIKNFSLMNYDGSQVFYRTNDPDANKFTFSFINTTGKDIILKGGNPAKPGALVSKGPRQLLLAEGDGSTFNINFEWLVPSDKVKDLIIETQDKWNLVCFPGDEGDPSSWLMAPAQDIVVKPKTNNPGDDPKNGQIDFIIKNAVCPNTAPGNFEILYSHIDGYADNSYPLMFHLEVQNVPDKDKKTLPLTCAYMDVVHPINGLLQAQDGDAAVPIYITYDTQASIENGFTLIVKNTSKDQLIPQGKVSEPVPEVYISFLFGNDDYQITDLQRSNNITIDVNPKSGSIWATVEHAPGSSSWKFLPQGMKGNETVEFKIRTIVTPPNVKEEVSVMYIQVNHFPRYNDGRYTLLLAKKNAEPRIDDDFSAMPRKIRFGENVTLQWATELAKSVTLEYDDRDGNTIRLDSAKGDIGLNASGFQPPVPPSAETTVFTLTAYGRNKDDKKSSQRFVTVGQPLPSVLSFTAEPSLIDHGTANKIHLSWEVKDAITVQLKRPREKPHTVDRKGNEDVTIDNLFEFQLSSYAYGSMQKAPVVTGAKVYSYAKQLPISMPLDPRVAELGISKMQFLPTILVNEAKSLIHVNIGLMSKVFSFDLNSPYKGPLKTYDADVMALSQDSKRLFVSSTVNTGLGVRMHDLETDSICNSSNVGWVSRILPTRDGSKLYCVTLGENRSINVTVINIVKETDRYYLYDGREISISSYRDVDSIAICLAVNSDESKLYILEPYFAFIQVINVSDNSPAGVIYLDKLNCKGANNLLYNNGILYITCGLSNVVVVVDTNVPRRVYPKINVGAGPYAMQLSNDGVYLYVANFGGNTISTIDLRTNTVVSTFTVGMGPVCLKLDPVDNNLFVANYCDKSITVIDLTSGTVLTPALSTGDGGNPFDIALHNEGNGVTRIFVAKEIYSQRTACGKPGRTNMDVIIYKIQKPTTNQLQTETELQYGHTH